FPKVDSAVLQWIDKNQIKQSKGENFEWAAHSFLIQPMSDWSPRLTVKKSSQVGFSESFGVLKALYAAIFYRWNVIYTLPTDTFAENIVKTKFDPIIKINPSLANIVTGTTSVKEINNRFIYFRGTHNTK